MLLQIADAFQAVGGDPATLNAWLSSDVNKDMIDGIWRLAASNPEKMAEHLPAWLAPLMRAQRFSDVEGLSLIAMVTKPSDTALVSTCQEAHVRAMLADGDYTQALPEAKVFYNIAPLSQSTTAINLLADALAKTKGFDVAQQFRKQQSAGMTSSGERAATNTCLLKSIDVNTSRFAQAIDRTANGSRYPFQNQISRGNLLLLADRPAEAQESFTKACGYVQSNWDVVEALKGIARTMRDQDCATYRATTWVNSLKAERSTKPSQISLPASLDIGRLRDAAREINITAPSRADLPPPQTEAFSSVQLPPASSQSEFSLPLNDPILLARLAPQSDPRLRSWLDRWQSDLSFGRAIDQMQQTELTEILSRSTLPLPALLHMANAFQASGGNVNVAFLWMTTCIQEADPRLASWLENSERESLDQNSSHAGSQLDLATILAKSPLSCESLYEFGGLLNTIINDPQDTAVAYAAAISRGHQELDSSDGFDHQTTRILVVMKNCEPLLWDRVNTGDSQYVDSIYILNCDIEKHVHSDDSTLGWAVPWAKIGIAECSYLKHDPESSLSILQLTQSQSLPEDQQIGLAWARALPLSELGRHAQAAIQLRIVATHAGPHQEQAWPLLITELCRLHRGSDAESAFVEYRQRYHLQPLAIATISAIVGDAEYNEQWEKSHAGRDIDQ